MKGFRIGAGILAVTLGASAVPAEAGVMIREVFNVEGNNAFSGFTAFATGTYIFEAAGGVGGGLRGGAGAVMTATFELNAGDAFLMLIGGQGKTFGNAGDGGGGTFIVRSSPRPFAEKDLFLAAGAGGGSGVASDNIYAWDTFGADASFGRNGTAGGSSLDFYYRGGLGGTFGGNGIDRYPGSGGGGFDLAEILTDTYGASFRQMFVSEVEGKLGVPTALNGGRSSGKAGGGGGGYSGGGGGNDRMQPKAGSLLDYGGGGGGGSYVASFGTLTNTAYNRTGNGYVRISFIERIAPPPPVAGVPEPSTWAMLILGFGLCGAAMRRRRIGSRLSYN